MSTVETTEKWLKCLIDKGMFSDEVAVTYPAQGAHRKSVFVPRDIVDGSVGAVGKVRVQIIGQRGNLMAVLPSAARDIVAVSDQDVTS